MKEFEGRYTLHYKIPADNAWGSFPFQRPAETLAEALATAWVTKQEGEDLVGISLGDILIFEGKTLQSVLDLMSKKGAEPGVPPMQVAQQIIPDVMAEQLAGMIRHANEYFGATVVYRDLLEDVYKAADEAIKKRNLELLYQITGKLAFWYVPGENDVKQWGKDFLHAYRRDAGWLHMTKRALEKIKAAAEQIEAPPGSHNAELKQEIIDAAENGLIPHI